MAHSLWEIFVQRKTESFIFTKTCISPTYSRMRKTDMRKTDTFSEISRTFNMRKSDTFSRKYGYLKCVSFKHTTVLGLPIFFKFFPSNSEQIVSESLWSDSDIIFRRVKISNSQKNIRFDAKD